MIEIAYTILIAVAPIAAATILWRRGILRIPRGIMPSSPSENAILRTWLLSILVWYGVVTPLCLDLASEGRWLEALAAPLVGALALSVFAMAFGGVAELAVGRLNRRKAFKAAAALAPVLLILLSVASFTLASGMVAYAALGAFALAVLMGLTILWAWSRVGSDHGARFAPTLRTQWLVVFAATGVGFALASWVAFTFMDGWTRVLVVAAYLMPVTLLLVGLWRRQGVHHDRDRGAGRN